MAKKDEVNDVELIADSISEHYDDCENDDLIPIDDDEIVIDDNTVLISSGSKMLNLACSDRYQGAFVKGRYVNLIGDSSAGKSFVALSMLAELANDSRFDNYRFIYDDAEEANSFNVKALFGNKLASRLEPPAMQKKVVEETGEEIVAAKNSATIQDFQLHVFDAIEHKDNKPFIYILDSFDSLSSNAEIKTAQDNMTALRKGTKEAGSYGMDKPKLIGQILRMIVSKLKKTESFLLIISQTRDDINPMTFTKKTRSGGHALKFYASHEIWLAVVSKLKKVALGHERQIGVEVKAKVTKNKLTGKVREVEFPIYYSYGIDDLRSCMKFIISTDAWKKEKNSYVVPELGITATEDSIIKQVEESNSEDVIFNLAKERWQLIEEKVAVKRKKKFQ